MSTKISARAAALLAGPVTLEPTSIVEALNPLTGLISAATAGVGITLTCPLGAVSDDGDWIEVQQQDLTKPLPNWIKIHGPIQFTLPAAGNSIDIAIPAPLGAGGFVHGQFQLRHLLYVNSFDDTGAERPSDALEFSAGTPFKVDRIAPYASLITRDVPPVSVYTGTLPVGAPLTQTIINADGGLPFTIPDNAYPLPSGQWELGDTLRYYWSQGLIPLPAVEVGATVPPRLMLQTGNTFTVPASAVAGSGNWNLFYTITDAAGNVSRPSVVSNFLVALLPAPEQREIFIPLAPAPEGGSLDNLLNIADYLAVIEAHVRTYLNHQPTLDQIQLKWGVQPFTAVSSTFTNFPLIYSGGALNPLIIADYANRRGPQPTAVQYRIVRNGETFDSLIKTINVDLSVTGPENPGLPGSRNPALNQAHIFGEGSLVPDVLTAEHANKPITVQIVLWTAADLPAPGQWIHVVGDDGIAVLPPFEITVQLPGDTISFTIPWASNLIKFNGPQNIHYFVAPSATPAPADNLNRAPDTPITVTDVVTITLAPPQFVRVLGSGPSTIWNCDSFGLRPQVTPADYDGRIFVPADARLVLGATLTLSVRVFAPRTGTPTADETRTFTQTITPAVVASGFTFIVPFDLLKIGRLGRVEATSIARITGNISGRGNASVNSRAALSNSFCDFSPLTP
ncbi:hypothetical protein AO391_03995 [Pseudomonas marginalis ICMP 9505]|uniref:Uncharacterized protein n=2 Tax=Pseudomonas kitaguniensis TaxID=2607908 RepID=A0A5N7JYY4_9PSED|nr:hypothetical protein [Pseudomonas kitaguniensis]KTC18719.1 hypothetical protein AO391_03995 [Pseudomonas marginalis ICMP 9505]MPQ86617.1 hypothetical protein [Pseudomonas kitaguniensis]